MSEKVTIYGPGYSNFVRCVVLCCQEKGVEYTLSMASVELKQLNPFEKVPVFEHDGVVIYETEAICRYLDRVFAGTSLSPSKPKELAWMDQWMSAAVCYFDSAIIRRYVLEYAFPKGKEGEIRKDVIAQAEKDINAYLMIMTEALKRYDYFSGSAAGIADYLIMPMLDYLNNGVVPTRLLNNYPTVKEYFDRMHQRPSCQQVLGKP